MEQLAFNLGDAGSVPPRSRDDRALGRQQRIFLALMPDEVAAAQIHMQARALHSDNQLTGRLLGAGRYHVSLVGLKVEVRRAEIAIALMRHIAEAITASSFDVAFDQALSFSPDAERPHLVLSSSDNLPALFELRDRLSQAMAKAGFRERSRFNPHVTLVYDRRVVAPVGIIPIRWRVEEFVLLRLQNRDRYERLGRWRLR